MDTCSYRRSSVVTVLFQRTARMYGSLKVGLAASVNCVAAIQAGKASEDFALSREQSHADGDEQFCLHRRH